MMVPRQRVLIVGCGLTSSMLSSMLSPAKFHVTIFEKANNPGGRFTTSLLDRSDPESLFDLGAQYLTSKNESIHDTLYPPLLSANVIRPFPVSEISGSQHRPSDRNYAATRGMSRVVEHYLGSSSPPPDVYYNVEVGDVFAPPGGGCVVALKQGARPPRRVPTELHFDKCVITAPLPQLLSAIGGDLPSLLSSRLSSLQAVQYSTRYTLALQYPTSSWPSLSQLPWSVKYTPSDPVLRYVSIEHLKRSGPLSPPPSPSSPPPSSSSSSGPVVVAHASIPYTLSRGGSGPNAEVPPSVLEAVAAEMEAAVARQLGIEGWEGGGNKASSRRLHRWRYSQVAEGWKGGSDGEGGEACDARGGDGGGLALGDRGQVILGGDGFAVSGFEGCYESACKLKQILEEGDAPSRGKL